MKKILCLFLVMLFVLSNISVMAETDLYEDIFLDADFSDGKTPYGTKITFNNEDGVISDNYKAIIGSDADGNPIYDEVHGRMVSVELPTAGAIPYFRMTLTTEYQTRGLYLFEAEYYFPYDDSGVTFRARKNGSNQPELFVFSANKINVCGTDVGTYTKGWYKVKLIIDTNGKSLRFFLNDTEITKQDNTSFTWTKDLTTLAQIRMEYKGNTYCVDNIKLAALAEGPVFTLQTLSPVAIDAEKIDISYTGTLDTDSINEDSVILSDADGIVEVDRVVESSGIISVYPRYNLTNSTAYQLVLNDKVKIMGQDLKTPVLLGFTTEASSIGSVTDPTYTLLGNTLKLNLNVTPAIDGKVCVITTLWDGTKLVSSTVKVYTSQDDSAQIQINGVNPGYTVKTVVVTDLNEPYRIGKPQYIYQN